MPQGNEGEDGHLPDLEVAHLRMLWGAANAVVKQ